MADQETGLLWELKRGPDYYEGLEEPAIACVSNEQCEDPHFSHNVYNYNVYSGGKFYPSTVFTEFLTALNDPSFSSVEALDFETIRDSSTGCFAGYCDWRLPVAAEFATLMQASDAEGTCSVRHCLNPEFVAVEGSNVLLPYRSGFLTSTRLGRGLEATCYDPDSCGQVGVATSPQALNIQQAFQHFARAGSLYSRQGFARAVRRGGCR